MARRYFFKVVSEDYKSLLAKGRYEMDYSKEGVINAPQPMFAYDGTDTMWEYNPIRNVLLIEADGEPTRGRKACHIADYRHTQREAILDDFYARKDGECITIGVEYSPVNAVKVLAEVMFPRRYNHQMEICPFSSPELLANGEPV